jgi:predicted ATPase/class 3 adenylate cyclase
VADEPRVTTAQTDDRRLPTGTVTFLFTDIVGSTRLLREDRQKYAAALDDHRRLLRAAFAAHGGREVDTQGDAFFVAFHTAGEAVAAAAEAQRSLAAQARSGGARVSVRMGMHTGEATVAGDGYVGLAVHRAARIATAAHGGQVLLSEVTAELVQDDLPAGTALRSLGEHQLKDFPRTTLLFQLDIVGLPTQFPPLRTTARQHRLPVPSGALLGRDSDLTALAELLTDSGTRLVTVTGPGGIGKTRLALESARKVADAFPGGVVFVPLSAVTDPALVLPTVADAIGARRQPGVEPLDAVRSVLGDNRTLLVLDNLEHLLAAAGELAALIDATATLIVLVTSRRALRLRAERLYPVAPLAAPSAEQLFVERAAAVRPGFTLDATNAAAVAEICRRLDGVPLAIELAAARVRLLPPAALLERLSARLDVLVGGPIDLPERQRTLRATMDWSYRLLGAHEQAVFSRLAVFSGGFEVSAAETVCGRPGEPDVLEALFTLLDASLLVEPDKSSGELRLDLLDTVRAYAVEQLAASGDRAEIERRHTDWVLAITDPLLLTRASDLRKALPLFDREWANVRAAARRALDAGAVETTARLLRNTYTYVLLRDAEREAAGWLDQILPRAAEAPADVRGLLLILRANFAGALGEVTNIRELWEEGRSLLPDDADHAQDQVLVALAGVYAAMADGSLDEVSLYVDEAASRSAALGLDTGVAVTAAIRGDLRLLLGDLEGAERYYKTALDLASRTGYEAWVGQVLSTVGLIQLAREDIPRGRRSILDGAELNRQGGQPTSIAYALEGLAAVASIDGRPVVAARAMAAAVAGRGSVAAALNAALTSLVDDVTARVRKQLGDQAYEAACAEGRQWPLNRALDRTLAELLDTDQAADTQETALRNSDGDELAQGQSSRIHGPGSPLAGGADHTSDIQAINSTQL